jgi:hypothetical protein
MLKLWSHEPPSIHLLVSYNAIFWPWRHTYIFEKSELYSKVADRPRLRAVRCTVMAVHATEVHRGNRSIALLIRSLHTRGTWVVNFTPRPLYSRDKSGTDWIGVWVDLRADMHGFGEEKIFRPCRDSNPEHSSPQLDVTPTNNISFRSKLCVEFSQVQGIYW